MGIETNYSKKRGLVGERLPKKVHRLKGPLKDSAGEFLDPSVDAYLNKVLQTGIEEGVRCGCDRHTRQAQGLATWRLNTTEPEFITAALTKEAQVLRETDVFKREIKEEL